MSTFIQSVKDDIAIDQEVIDLYEDMGWTEWTQYPAFYISSEQK
jgi:hypothetical protein